MPMYEYRCGDCGRMFETFVTADRAPECPACHGSNLGKLLSSPGLVGGGNGRTQSQPVPAAGGCGMGTCGCRPDLN